MTCAWLVRAISAVAVAGALAACKDDAVRAPAGPPCPEDAGCAFGQVAAQGSTGTGGAGGGTSTSVGGASVEVSGTVGVLTTTSFDQTQFYAGEATIQGDSVSGGTVSTTWGGDAGTGFTLTGLPPGADWLLVEPTATTSAMDTYSLVALPSASALTLPVVDRAVMTSIVGLLPTPITIDPNAAQIIMALTRAGAPLAGVKMATGPTAGAIAYDVGPGAYSTDSTATSTGGVVLLLNANASNVQTEASVQLIDAQGTSFPLTLRMRAGAATFARVSL